MKINQDTGRKRLTRARGYEYETRLGGPSFFTKKPYFIFDELQSYHRQEKVHPVSDQYRWIEISKKDFYETIETSKKLKMPDFLNRSLWKKRDHERSQKAWDRIIRENSRERSEARAKSEEEIFRKVRSIKRVKALKTAMKSKRREERDERKARRVRKIRIQGEHDDQILGFLKSGSDTSGKLVKKTGLDPRSIRQSLKRLIASGKVIKASARVYVPKKANPSVRSS